MMCCICQKEKKRDHRVLSDVCEDCIKKATEEDLTLAELKIIYRNNIKARKE